MPSFLKRSAIVAMGSAAGQAAQAAATPFLTRLFGPEDYGASGIVMALTTACVLASTLNYDAVIIAGKSPRVREVAFGLSIAMSVVVACVTLVFLFLGGNVLLAEVLNNDALGVVLYFLPLLLFLATVQAHVLPKSLVSLGRYKEVSIGDFANGCLGAVAQLVFGVLGMGPAGLLLGRTAGFASAIAVMARPISKSRYLAALGWVRYRHMRRVFIGYRRQALFLAPAGIFNIVATQLPMFVIAAAYGATASGVFILTQNLAFALLTVYRKTVSAVMAAEVKRRLDARISIVPFLRRILGVLLLAGGAMSAMMFLFAEDLVPVILGKGWEQAGTVAKWVVFFHFAWAMALPLRTLATVLRFQRFTFMIQLLELGAILLALTWGVYVDDFELTVAAFSLSSAVIVLGGYVLIWVKVITVEGARTVSR